MNEQAPAVTLRPVTPDDQDFLFQLYASTRAEELASLNWSDMQRTVFLRAQFDAQRRDYTARFPVDGHQIILVEDERAGRIWVAREREEIRVVDIALLPSARGRGIGTQLIKELIAEAAATGKPLRLSVPKHREAARRLYERLGWRPAQDRREAVFPPHPTEMRYTRAIAPGR
jgi:ribosomal protein S18 acetylase RimI-like enzyme